MSQGAGWPDFKTIAGRLREAEALLEAGLSGEAAARAAVSQTMALMLIGETLLVLTGALAALQSDAEALVVLMCYPDGPEVRAMRRKIARPETGA